MKALQNVTEELR